jgi:hypothetical protein
MAKDVRIIWVTAAHGSNREDGTILSTQAAERKIAKLLDEGWIIATAGGGFGTGFHDVSNYGGFIVLQHD